MKLFRKKLFFQQQLKAGFINLFGAHSLFAISLVIFTIISLDWFGDGLLTILTNKVATTGLAKQSTIHLWLKLIPFPVIFMIWGIIIQTSIKEIGALKIREYDNVPPSKVLIKFLSLVGTDTELVEELNKSAEAKSNDLNDVAFREKFKGGWRMSLEAIAHHSKNGVLEKVIVIPSADTLKAGKIQEGTHKSFEAFKKLVESALSNVSVLSAGESNTRWEKGVDYESAREINECLYDVFSYLHDNKYDDSDIIVDITSGQKVGSGVASIFCLDAGRQFQYVSTHDYSIKSYDILYEQKQN